MDSVLLASGGLDSTTLGYWLAARGIGFQPLFINYGQHCAQTELATLRRVLPDEWGPSLEILQIKDIYRGSSSRMIREPNLWEDEVSSEDFYLPYRNLLLLTVGAAYAQAGGYTHLYAAFINSNHAKEIDCSAEFFQKLAVLLKEYGTVEVEMPFRNMSKYEVARIGIGLQAPIGETFSCQASSGIPCGACPNCVDRLDALRRIADEA